MEVEGREVAGVERLGGTDGPVEAKRSETGGSAQGASERSRFGFDPVRISLRQARLEGGMCVLCVCEC